MKKLKTDIIASFKNRRINVFILFLLLAFIILIFAKLSKVYTNTISFEIEKLNIPQENVILKDSVAFNITLKTHGFKWLKYYFSKPKIEIDFSKDVYKKEAFFIWNKSKAYLNNTQFGKDVELLSITPDLIKFRYGIHMRKKVPVKINEKINFFPGFDMVNDLVLEPDSISIIGPNTLISKINYLETEAIILNDVRGAIKETVNLKIPEKISNLKFSSRQIKIKGDIQKFTEGALSIPIIITNIPENTELKYFPRSVNVSYYVSLNDFNKITTNDFKVICDFKEVGENKSFLTPKLIKSPKFIKNTRLGQKRIEFIVIK